MWIIFLAVAATAPALLGNGSLGPEALLDIDPLYARETAPHRASIFDPTRVYFDVPRDFAAADGFQQGRLDLWNPRVSFGRPLWFDGGALFFPAKVPFYLWPSRRTYDVATAIRLVIAGLGGYLLARRRGLAPVPAVAAGTLFELSGAMLSTLPFAEEGPPCLLPWVLLGANLIAQKRLASAAAATGLGLGLAGGSGHVMLVVVVWAGFGVAVGGHALANWRQPRTAVRIIALAGLAAIIGVALAAPALLPVLEAQDIGRQYKGTSIYEGQLNNYRPQLRIAFPVALLMPYSVGALRAELPSGFPHAFVGPTIGAFGLIFAVAGLVRGGLDPALIAVALFGVGLTLAPPVLGWVRDVPLLYYVYPMYAWSLLALPLTQAAGRGVAALSVRGERWTILAGLTAMLLCTGSLLLVGDQIAVRLEGEVPAFPAIFPDGVVGFLMRNVIFKPRTVLPMIFLPLAVVALVVGARTRFGDRWTIVATAAAGLELVVFVAPTAWFPDSSTLGSPPSNAVTFLQHVLREGRYRMIAWPLEIGCPATPSLFGLSDVRGNAPLPVERYVRYLEAISWRTSWYVWQAPGRVVRHPLLDLASVRYVVGEPGSSPEPLLQKDGLVRLVFRDEWVAIYENQAALPRARVVHQAVAVRDEADAFRRLVDAAAGSTHAPARLVDRVFVEPSADGHAPTETAAPVPPPSPEIVSIVPGKDPDRVELHAVLARPGWVVLADTFYPGWTATIDGVPTSIHPANLLFRGVFVGAGAHRIVFRYQPPVFRVGLALAAGSLVVAGFLLLRARR